MVRRRVLIRVLLPILAIVFTIALMELGLRLIRKPNYYAGWKPNQVLASEMNQLGYRGKKIEYTDEDFVVVLLGDSQVYAAGCAFGWLPEARLEHHLGHALKKKVKVFSVAAEGWGTDQELLALQEYFTHYRANLVLLWFTPQNDLQNNLQVVDGQGIGKLKPAFWVEEGRLKGPNFEWLAPVLLGGLRLGGLLDRAGLWPSIQKTWSKTHGESRENAVLLTQLLLERMENAVKSQGAQFVPFWASAMQDWHLCSTVSQKVFQKKENLQILVGMQEPYFGRSDWHFNEHAVDVLTELLVRKLVSRIH